MADVFFEKVNNGKSSQNLFVIHVEHCQLQSFHPTPTLTKLI